jgi:hypothetical protein
VIEGKPGVIESTSLEETNYKSGDYFIWYLKKKYGGVLGCEICELTAGEVDKIVAN